MLDTLSNSAIFSIAAFTIVASALASLTAWLLRGAHFPGGWASAAILAGVFVGVLLGPGVFGRIAPETHRAVIVGATVEQQAFDDRVTEARGAIAALEASGVTGVAIEEYERSAIAEIEPLGAAVDEAMIRRRGAWNVTLAALGAGLLALLPLAGVRSDSGEIPFSRRRAAMLAGLGSVVVSGGIALLGVLLLTKSGVTHAALLFAAACAVGWFVPPFDRAAHERSRAIHESFVSGLFALTVAAAVSLWFLPDQRGWFIGWAFIGALALWVISKAAMRNHRARVASHAVVLGVIAPTVAALAASRIDLMPLVRAPIFWGLLLFAIIASTDAKWFGALLGARALEHAKGALTRQSVEIATAHANTGAGLAQVALLAVLAAGGPIDEALLAAGLLGALLLESCAGVYRWGGAWLDHMIAEK